MRVANAFRRWFSRPAKMGAILLESGMLVCREPPVGGFESWQIAVPTDGQRALPWYLGRSIQLRVEAGALVLVGNESGGEEVTLYRGPAGEVAALASAVQQRWLEANQTLSGVGAGGRAGGAGAGYFPGPSAAASSALLTPARSGRRALGFGIVAAGVSVFAVGWVATTLYLRPSGPALNLSAMTIEQVAAMDSNPAAMRAIQEDLMKAALVGQEHAQKLAGKIEQDHLDGLRAMGLKPGLSAKNAMSCLAGG